MRVEVPETLIEQMKQGSIEARDEIAIQMMPLMNLIIRSWCKKFPYQQGDISGVAWLALLTSLDKAVEKDVSTTYLVGYCKMSVEGKIMNHLKDDTVIRTPRYKQDEERKQDINWRPPECLSMSDPDWCEIPDHAPQQEFAMLEFYEFCFARMSLSPIEKEILNHARMGFNNVEIAGKLNLSHTIINRYKNDMEVRFNKIRNNPSIKERFFGES